eukprot:7543281-Pyramimonas_sp.AAC.1
MPRFEKGGPTNREVLAAADRPLAPSLLRVSRLRLFGKIAHAGPNTLIAVLQEELRVSKNSWLHEIPRDLEWLRSAHFKFEGFPLPSLGARQWLAEISRSQSAWKRTLREALLAPVARLKKDIKAMAWEI